MLHASGAPRTRRRAVFCGALRFIAEEHQPNETIIPADAIARAAMVSCRPAFASIV